MSQHVKDTLLKKSKTLTTIYFKTQLAMQSV